MEIRVLRYFLAVAREESISRAAEYLHVTQPTLSRQLMQLEEELQVKLFNRTSHSVVLTEDGLLFKRRAQEIVALSEKQSAIYQGEQGTVRRNWDWLRRVQKHPDNCTDYEGVQERTSIRNVSDIQRKFVQYKRTYRIRHFGYWCHSRLCGYTQI